MLKEQSSFCAKPAFLERRRKTFYLLINFDEMTIRLDIPRETLLNGCER